MTTVVANLATYVNCTLIFLASGSTAIFQSNITEKELDRNTLAEYGWGEGRGEWGALHHKIPTWLITLFIIL